MGSAAALLTGLCAGIVSGSALCAFYIALGVFSKSAIALGLQHTYKPSVVCSSAGGVFGTVVTVFNVRLQMGTWWPGIFGLLAGIYVGIFIGCLADVVSTIPVIKTLGISNRLISAIFIAFVLGKLVGSLIYWLSGTF